MTDKTDTFKCEACGGVFEKGWTDEEATADMLKNFGDIPEDDRAVICEKCHDDFMAWLRNNDGIVQ